MFRAGQRVYQIGRSPRREGTIRRRRPDGLNVLTGGEYFVFVEWDDAYLSKPLSGPLPEPVLHEYSGPPIPEFDMYTIGPGFRPEIAPISAIDLLADILR